jgi:hypothetical protein
MLAKLHTFSLRAIRCFHLYNGTDNPRATSGLFVGNTALGSMSISCGFVVNMLFTGHNQLGQTHRAQITL